MSLHEIVLPETKPETEWILGHAVQKVSPRWTHARLQARFAHLLLQWEAGHGKTATEWRFRIAPPNEIRRPLVPDVAFVSNERLRGLEREDVEIPPFAPDVAIEILSPGDRSRFVEHKIGVYVAGGASLVIVIDPATAARRCTMPPVRERSSRATRWSTGRCLDSPSLCETFSRPPIFERCAVRDAGTAAWRGASPRCGVPA